MPLIVIPILLAIAMTIPFPLVSIPISLSRSPSQSRSRVSTKQSKSFVVFGHCYNSLVADGPRGIYCVVVVGSNGDKSVLDVGRELVGSALGEIEMLAAAVIVVVLELPLKFLGPGHDSINALGPLGGDLWIGLGAAAFGLRLDNGGVDGPVAIFIARGAVGGLSRVREGASLETEGEIGCDEGTAGDAHLLPCPGGVPHPVNGGAARLQVEGATAPWNVHGGDWGEVVTQLGLKVRCWM